ncbi:hypothetical protein [Nitrosopumilus ureiphilus]|uniref:Transcriptional regulator n=1 Tax=Nitrosopumilus ureiphilus TaxID=1470067 RepID=A0A7D5M4Y2_9ARCH|nr:hypothetical protein [Nitrosopumilus ureiphilus]QLH07186.1 hypothetical protein C5F50_08920 [Nitrosopumilus ureiphilus]
MLTDEEIKGRIIRKLYRRGNWGASHTSFENLKKGFTQRDAEKQGSKKVDKMGESLIKENLILSKPTGYGLEVSLNPKMIEKIQEYLEEE